MKLKDSINIPSVTIIVPVYNAEGVLKSCIKSILDLDYPKEKLELIFVDNNSNDKSYKILQKYISRIKLLKEMKQGPAAARNKGIKHASHEIIVFTDADSIADKEWLKNLIDPLVKNKDICMVGGSILAKRPCNKIEKYGEIIHDHEKAIKYLKPPYFITMNVAIWKKDILEAGMFDENFLRGEDVDLSFRLHKEGCKFEFAPEAVIFHKNESNLLGLFNEGFLHGFWNIKVRIKHNISIIKPKNVFLMIYLKLFFIFLNASFKIFFLNNESEHRLYDTAFRLGKEIGKFCYAVKYKILY